MECSISSRKAYKRTSCGEIGRRKSENIISVFEGIREDSDSIPKSDYTKAVIKKLVFAFSVRTILSDRRCDFFRKIPTLAECGS